MVLGPMTHEQALHPWCVERGARVTQGEVERRARKCVRERRRALGHTEISRVLIAICVVQYTCALTHKPP